MVRFGWHFSGFHKEALSSRGTVTKSDSHHLPAQTVRNGEAVKASAPTVVEGRTRGHGCLCPLAGCGLRDHLMTSFLGMKGSREAFLRRPWSGHVNLCVRMLCLMATISTRLMYESYVCVHSTQ